MRKVISPKLTPELLAESLRIARMPDEDIDFSDIPPLGEDFWKNASNGKILSPEQEASQAAAGCRCAGLVQGRTSAARGDTKRRSIRLCARWLRGNGGRRGEFGRRRVSIGGNPHCAIVTSSLARQRRGSILRPYAQILRSCGILALGISEHRNRLVLQSRPLRPSGEKGDLACLLSERNSDGHLIGFTGLSVPNFLPEIMPAVEIGWRFARSSWGCGYATEAAQAALDFGLTHLRLPDIVSIYQIENEASRRIMEKLGMTFERETVDPVSGRIVGVYRTVVAD